MKKLPDINLVQEMRDYFTLSPFMEIMPWIDKYISYADDVSAERDKPDWSFFPYQVEIIKTWEDIKTRKHVAVCACEQMGKSNTWILGLLWRMVYDPCQSLIVYPRCREVR